MTQPDSTDTAGVLVAVALRLQTLEHDLEVSFGVNDELAAALTTLPDVETRETVYVGDRTSPEPYVLRAVTARVGRVRLHALAHARPATSAEIESAANWTEHLESDYRSGELRRAGA